MTVLFSNNAETTLQIAALVSDTAMTVRSGDSGLFNVLAAGQTELVTITDGTYYEVVEITGWTGDVATVVRGVEGTAQAWGIGAIFSGRVTAGALGRMAQKIDTTAAYVMRAGDATTQAVDLGVLFPNPRDIPPFLIVPPATTGVTNVVLPSLTGFALDEVLAIDFRKFLAGTAQINIAVQVGDYMKTLNGTDFLLSSIRARFAGYFDGTVTHWSW